MGIYKILRSPLSHLCQYAVVFLEILCLLEIAFCECNLYFFIIMIICHYYDNVEIHGLNVTFPIF